MKKAYIVIIFLLGAAIALSMTKAVLYNALSTSGTAVSQAEQQINFYKTQNAILSEELLVASSLTTIAEKAKESGFIDKKALIIVKTSGPLAVRP